MRRLVYSFIFLVGLAGGALPAAAQGSPQTSEAIRLVESLGEQAIEALADPNSSRQAVEQRFERLLETGFDVPYIARFVLSGYWEQATPEQRREYMRLFEQLIVEEYTDRFMQYSDRDLDPDQTLQILDAKPAGDRDIIVSSEIRRPDASPVKVDWRVRERDGELRVIDAAVEGVSVAVSQRSEFASIIERGGGRVEALLNELRAQVG